MRVPEEYRIKTGEYGCDTNFGCMGAFDIPVMDKIKKRIIRAKVISSDEKGWEHVSVSLRNRTPTWEQMCKIKSLFWDENETVIQYHPAKANYVNCHPHTLHLWRPINAVVPTPPIWMV